MFDYEKPTGKKWGQEWSNANYVMHVSDRAPDPSGTKGDVVSEISTYIYLI